MFPPRYKTRQEHFNAAGGVLQTVPFQEVVAISMLLGDVGPMVCSACVGKGLKHNVLGGFKLCVVCEGLGYSLLGSKTLNAILERA
jgi:hypothetical protein